MRYGGSWSIYFLVEWTICWRLGCCFQSTADSSNLSGKRLIKMCYWYEPGLRVPFFAEPALRAADFVNPTM